MAKKRAPGLYKRKGVWHIDKQLFGQRLCESTGTASLAEAELYLARRIEEIRQHKVFGVRPTYMFDEAAKKYVCVKRSKKTIKRDIGELNVLHQYLSGQPLEVIHMENFKIKRYIQDRQEAGLKNRSINYGLQVLRHLLKLAAEEWIDDCGMSWLIKAPKIKLLPTHDARKPRPLSWEEQKLFFSELSPLLQKMALFGVNTGCRDQEICQLRWEWEVPVPELQTSFFLLPGWYQDGQGKQQRFIKNGEDKLVVLNKVAKAVVEHQRGNGSDYVFTHRYKGKLRPYWTMNTNGWQRARKRIGLEVRVHDLRHTFGSRLRAAGVSYEDRQDLLGHKSGRITTHYSAAEVYNLIAAADLIAEPRIGDFTLTVVKEQAIFRSRKSPARGIIENDYQHG